MTILITRRSDLTLENARRVVQDREDVALGAEALAAMEAGRERLMRILEHDPDVTIYGVTTGAGQMAKHTIRPEDRRSHARMAPTGAAASWGDPLPDRVVRLIILARLSNFIEGHAAVSPEIAQGVAAMLGEEDMPVVPARGQGGAGEILSLSHLFAPLVEAVGADVKDVMCLVNGSPAATGLVTDAALTGEARLDLATRIFALSFEAFNAPLGHLAGALEDYWNNACDAWALKTMRTLIDGGHGGDRRPYQAPVSYRIAPRMLGQARRAVDLVRDVAGESLQAVTDNPVWIDERDDDNPFGQFVSTGGYHNPHAVLAMDALTAATANLCVLAERHGAKLLDGRVSLLPDQLIGPDQEGQEGGVRRGYMGCLPMAQTGYEEEARYHAQATVLPGSESGGFGQNDVASPVFLAWTKLQRASECLDLALASLAPIAVRALDVTGRPIPAPLAGLAEIVRNVFPNLEERRAFGPLVADIAAAFRATIHPS